MPSYMNMNLYSPKILLSYKIKENASVERAIFNSARFVYEIFINRIHEGGHQISVKLCTNKERRKVYLYLCIPKLYYLSSIYTEQEKKDSFLANQRRAKFKSLLFYHVQIKQAV